MSSPSVDDNDFASAFERFSSTSRPANTTEPTSEDSSHYELAAEQLSSNDASVHSPMSQNHLHFDPEVDYPAKARGLVNQILRDPRLEQADVQVLVQHLPLILARGRSPVESAYMFHKLSDMAEDVNFILASTMVHRKSSRPALMSCLSNHVLGMMNLFAMAMEPITTTPIDLSTICPCNAVGHVCQIDGCKSQHVCVSVGLTAKDSMEYGLIDGVREMPPPTICPGCCRLPHGLRAADIVCTSFIDNPTAHADKYGADCVLGHDQPDLRRALLDEHRRLCPAAVKAPAKEQSNDNPGTSQENARPELTGSKKKSLWNLGGLRK